MKPIKVTDQEVLSKVTIILRAEQAMHYWTQQYLNLKESFFDLINEKYPITKKEPCKFNPETNTLYALHETSKKKEEA
jgi:hypothetical protein